MYLILIRIGPLYLILLYYHVSEERFTEYKNWTGTPTNLGEL
jgi:hypothetical protein